MFHDQADTCPSKAEHKKPETLHVATWNLGGLTTIETLNLLLNMRRGRIHPFEADFVVFLQAIIMESGAQSEKDDVQKAAG